MHLNISIPDHVCIDSDGTTHLMFRFGKIFQNRRAIHVTKMAGRYHSKKCDATKIKRHQSLS